MGQALFEKHDRVKLALDMAKGMMRERARRRRRGGVSKQVDWMTREGTVVRVSMVTDAISVVWDDRASVDQWPARALIKLARIDGPR